MIFKFAQLVLFAIVPYLVVAFATPGPRVDNDPVGAQEVVEADTTILADEVAEREAV